MMNLPTEKISEDLLHAIGGDSDIPLSIYIVHLRHQYAIGNIFNDLINIPWGGNTGTQ